jgi:hypothetical protein
MIEKRLKEGSTARKEHGIQLDMGLPVLRVLQHPGEKYTCLGLLHRAILRNSSGSKAVVEQLAALTPSLAIPRCQQDPTPFHPERYQLATGNIKSQSAHLKKWDHGTVRVKFATFVE